jgi:hypothetical protein
MRRGRCLIGVIGLLLAGCPEPRQLGGSVRVVQGGLTARLSVLSQANEEQAASSPSKSPTDAEAQATADSLAGGAGGALPRGSGQSAR